MLILNVRVKSRIGKVRLSTKAIMVTVDFTCFYPPLLRGLTISVVLLFVVGGSCFV